ncbi:hemicentin-2 [Anopheles stephensi]|uniref:hemicentin-2 n=1 Tax=Anopheles stephensi TaxID=30069 RepID=UPI00165888DC|nr:hemicentin-2 [Anopheles stephensi]
MGRKLAHHLVLVGALLVLAVESFSQALQEADDYTGGSQPHHLRSQQQNAPHHHNQHHHRHRTEQARSRNQTSLNYSLVSGPGYGNGGSTDYRPPYQGTVQQHWAHGQQHGGGHRETPPQHRRHHRAQSHPQQQPGAHGWRRTSSSGTVPGARPVNRMLTRSGTSSLGASRHNNSTRNRNVCTVYIYRKSVVKTYPNAPCTDPANCSGLRTYPVAKRETCCRGWDTTTTVADGCFKPVCQTPCRNGGQCTAPDRCTCPTGFTGKYCEMDVNECKEHKPCDQTCYNTEGSYYCTCREGFMLQSDRQSCKKIDEANDLATEARDMENDLDVDYDSLDIRLRKLEQMVASRDDRQELNKKVQYTMEAVSVLKSQVARLSQRLFPSVDYGNRVH